MTTPSSNQARTWREGRRLRAWELHQQGWGVRRIARALGVTPGAVSQWLARAQTAGIAALHDQPCMVRTWRTEPKYTRRNASNGSGRLPGTAHARHQP